MSKFIVLIEPQEAVRVVPGTVALAFVIKVPTLMLINKIKNVLHPP